MIKKIIRCSWFFLLVLTAVPLAGLDAFNGLRWHDDQGVLMMGIKDMLDGRAPYVETTFLYGPVYYFSMALLFGLLGIPLTHDAVLVVSVVFQLLCSAMNAYLLFCITRSRLVAVYCFLISILFLQLLSHSPLHPQEILLLISGIGFWAIWRLETRQRGIESWLLGCILAAMMLVKINYFAYYLLPLLIVALSSLRNCLPKRLLLAFFVSISLVLPAIVTRPLLGDAWAVDYCLFSTATIGGMMAVWLTLAGRTSNICYRAIIECGVSFLATVVFMLIVSKYAGLHFLDVLDAVIFDPMRRTATWYVSPDFAEPVIWNAATSFALACAYALGTRFKRSARYGELLVVAFKFLYVTFLLILCFLFLYLVNASLFINGPIFKYFLPYMWIFLIPTARTMREPVARQAVVLFAGFMSLYPFPVLSVQSLIASLWPVLLVPLLINDVKVYVHQNRTFSSAFRHIVVWMHDGLWNVNRSFLYVVLGGLLGLQTIRAAERRYDYVPLDFPGATLIRVKPEDKVRYTWAAQELARCRSYYILPNQPSFYLWGGRPTQTGLMSNNTLGLLTDSEQETVISALASNEDICMLYIPSVLEIFDRGQLEANPPLIRYLKENFEPRDSFDGFEIWQRK